MAQPSDERAMRLALALGYRNLGRTWTNPSVGAVLLDPVDGRIISVGVTQPGGRPHAERIALAEAGESARGRTLYVSLEPCSHHGGTSPCAEAVVRSGVARVVTSLEDPDARVAGRGHALIRAAGIAVTTGLLAGEAARDHRGHLTRVREGRPAVSLKIAQTAEGFAAGDGGRLIITGEGANARTHMLRAHADAVLIGVSTVLADDPRLDVRLPGMEKRSPLRVVLDSRLRTPRDALVVGSSAARPPLWIVCGPDAEHDKESQLTDAGATIIRVAADGTGRIDLRAALTELGARGLTRILSEAGPTLADALARDDLVDEAIVMTNERPFGGPGLKAIGPHLSAALGARLRSLSDEQVEPDRIQVFERAS